MLIAAEPRIAVSQFILAIDQGTTSTRAILFRPDGAIVRSAARPLAQHYPADGWVEHDAEEIWQAALSVTREVLAGTALGEVAGIGITNQRETTVLWDRKTGTPLHRAIVWQDRRTADQCAKLAASGLGPMVQERTGLLLDPYFSGTKLAWLLDHVPGARARAERGELAFGTIDSWLIYRLTGGIVHATDATNASRTMLYNIVTGAWDGDLLKALNVPASVLPEVRDSAADFGTTEARHFGAPLRIGGVAGDQQAAALGQACLSPGLMKATYGTGCFALTNVGSKAVTSQNRLLGTVAYRLGGASTYALEGSIFMAGATIQWLRDGLKLFTQASESEAMAKAADLRSGVILVPAFVGLGAPYWDPHARGAILGLTRDSGPNEIVRAGLESVAFQTRDLIEAMAADMKAAGLTAPAALRIDGGMVANAWFCQTLADLIGLPVERPFVTETTAFGAAALAGLSAGLFDTPEAFAKSWRLERRFEPTLAAGQRDERYARWKDAVGRIMTRPA